MDLNDATKAHAESKVRLRNAIANQERLDVATISADNCCALGKWLHGEARSRYDQRPAYRECVTAHAAFHREAGAVAKAINAGDYGRASTMLNLGTPYSAASGNVVAAIGALKKVLTPV